MLWPVVCSAQQICSLAGISAVAVVPNPAVGNAPLSTLRVTITTVTVQVFDVSNLMYISSSPGIFDPNAGSSSFTMVYPISRVPGLSSGSVLVLQVQAASASLPAGTYTLELPDVLLGSNPALGTVSITMWTTKETSARGKEAKYQVTGVASRWRWCMATGMGAGLGIA